MLSLPIVPDSLMMKMKGGRQTQQAAAGFSIQLFMLTLLHLVSLVKEKDRHGLTDVTARGLMVRVQLDYHPAFISIIRL